MIVRRLPDLFTNVTRVRRLELLDLIRPNRVQEISPPTVCVDGGRGVFPGFCGTTGGCTTGLGRQPLKKAFTAALLPERLIVRV